MEQRFWTFAFRVLAISVLLLAVADAGAQEARVGVLGAPEEPRFSEVVAGLKKGLGELGYTAQALQILEARIARADEDAMCCIGRISDQMILDFGLRTNRQRQR